jgi:hypothetical protein
VAPARTQALIGALVRPMLVAWIKGANHVSLYDRVEYRQAFARALERILAAPADRPLPASATIATH